jgi:hypothetical protein
MCIQHQARARDRTATAPCAYRLRCAPVSRGKEEGLWSMDYMPLIVRESATIYLCRGLFECEGVLVRKSCPVSTKVGNSNLWQLELATLSACGFSSDKRTDKSFADVICVVMGSWVGNLRAGGTTNSANHKRVDLYLPSAYNMFPEEDQESYQNGGAQASSKMRVKQSKE